jgi:hypothetical protein
MVSKKRRVAPVVSSEEVVLELPIPGVDAVEGALLRSLPAILPG